MKNIYYKLCAMMSVFLLANNAVAATFGDKDLTTVSTKVSKNVKAIADVISVVCYIAGLALGIAGLLKLKEHMESPGQTKLGVPMSRLLIAALLLALPTVLNVIVGSTVGDAGTIDASVVGIKSK